MSATSEPGDEVSLQLLFSVIGNALSAMSEVQASVLLYRHNSHTPTETFDGILKEKLAARRVLAGGVVDEFDMTFPWHYDNRCNDGVHQGRKPAKAKWRDGQIGHQYFVDLMLVHVLLNAFCNG